MDGLSQTVVYTANGPTKLVKYKMDFICLTDKRKENYLKYSIQIILMNS